MTNPPDPVHEEPWARELLRLYESPHAGYYALDDVEKIIDVVYERGLDDERL